MASRAVPAVFSITMYDPIANHPKNLKEAKFTAWPSHCLQLGINLVKIVVQRFFLSTSYLTKHFTELSLENFRHFSQKQISALTPVYEEKIEHVAKLAKACFEGSIEDWKVRKSDECVLESFCLNIRPYQVEQHIYPTALTQQVLQGFIDAFVQSNPDTPESAEAIRHVCNILMITECDMRPVMHLIDKLTPPKTEEFLNALNKEELVKVFRATLGQISATENFGVLSAEARSFKDKLLQHVVRHVKVHPSEKKDFSDALIVISKGKYEFGGPNSLWIHHFEQLITALGADALFQIIKEGKQLLQTRALIFLIKNWEKAASDFSAPSANEHFVSLGETFTQTIERCSMQEIQDVVKALDMFFSLPGSERTGIDSTFCENKINGALLPTARKLLFAGHKINQSADAYAGFFGDSFRRSLFSDITPEELATHPVQLSLFDIVCLNSAQRTAFFKSRSEDHQFWFGLAQELEQIGGLGQYGYSDVAKYIRDSIQNKMSEVDFFTAEEKAELAKLNTCYKIA